MRLFSTQSYSAKSLNTRCTGVSLVKCSVRTVGVEEFRGRRIVGGDRNDSGTLSVSGELAITSSGRELELLLLRHVSRAGV
jgi:hypothetical protein